MRLGVNVIRLTRLFTGVGRYIECVLKEWSQMEIPFDEIVLYTNAPLKQDQVSMPLHQFKIEIFGPKAPDPLWEWKSLKAKANEIDVLFCPSYTIPLGYSGRSVVTNHGPPENALGSYQWWRSQVYERLYQYSAHKADKVLACSHSVKRRLVKVYGISQSKIKVTYLASSDAFRPIADKKILNFSKQKYLSEETPYILFVGKLAKRHYIPNLIQAFSEVFKAKALPHKLMIVGPDYLKLNVAKIASRFGIADAVIHIPYVKHTDLPPLYNGAELFIFPASEAEGFGIPVLEAMACGTPVITVDQGSLSEFARGVSYLVRDSSVKQLRSGLEEVIGNTPLKKDLAKKGIERARSMTWKNTAEKTMDLLWEVANSN